MIDDVTFREARADDARGIGAVHVASWQSAYAGLLPRTVLEEQDVDARTRFWKRCLAGAQWPVLVAESARSIVGFASFVACRDGDLDSSTTSELAAIYLLPEARGRGVGTELLARGFQEATSRGYRVMSLWVLAGNHVAVRFYERHGFMPDGAIAKDPRLTVDEIRMLAVLPR